MTITRRGFVTGALAFAGCRGGPAAEEAPTLRVGLVGCGSRGKSAAENCLAAAPNVELVALADLFPDRLARARKVLEATGHPGVRIDPARCFSGFDACRKLLAAGVDLAILAAPPGFRPAHFEAAVEAGAHVFLEKPAAVDPPGVRRVLEAGQRAAAKGLAVVAGTQYRHQASFVETMRRIREGAIGELLSGRVYYHTGANWAYARKAGESDAEWQIRNWPYFDWLSGDHIVEQHLHTIDVMCWVMGSPPLRAAGSGGRAARTGPEFGNVYDHFAVDFEFPGGRRVASFCRQMANTANRVGAWFTGSEGTADVYAGRIAGRRPWSYPGTPSIAQAYVQEHADLVASIRSGRPLDETRAIAESTLAAILGREAAYTGGEPGWDEIAASDLELGPREPAFGPLEARPVPVPGTPR